MYKRILPLLLAVLLAACDNEPYKPEVIIDPVNPPVVPERIIVCNEGNWQSDNGQLSLYDGQNGLLTNQWFRTVNGQKLGDTPNDIIQVNDTLIAIAINWSNIIQYIHPDGTACGATENVPNNRRLCSDGEFLYVTSYAHRCGSQTFQKGYVAKIDVRTKAVVGTCEVGWEPEGIRLYDGRLYVANSGGYAFQEGHDYEQTVSVLDAASMTVLRTIDTGRINLYGDMAQAGRYLCINACGDYYDVQPSTVILDCETEQVRILPFPSTISTSTGHEFYTVGSAFSYLTGETVNHFHTIDPSTMKVTDEILCPAVTKKLQELTSPYAIHYSTATHCIYFTDAKSYATAGMLYGYTPWGDALFEPQKVYINPGHILTLELRIKN